MCFPCTVCYTNTMQVQFRTSYPVDSPKYNLNLRIKTESVTAFVYTYLVRKPCNYRCICYNRDRLGFYAEIQIICIWGQCVQWTPKILAIKKGSIKQNKSKAIWRQELELG